MASPRQAELQRLVDAEDVDGVLRVADLDELADAWCRHTAREHPTADDPDWWAVEFFMMRPLFDAVEVHRAALLKLLEHAPDDRVIGCIGAGPLENFVSDDPDDLAWLETQAASNPRLRAALAGMWVALDLTEETLARLDRAAGTELTRPPPRDEWPAPVREYQDALDEARRHLGDDWWDHVDDDLTPEQEAAARRMLGAVESLTALAEGDDEDGNTGS
jgi:hypothetical protein